MLLLSVILAPLLISTVVPAEATWLSAPTARFIVTAQLSKAKVPLELRIKEIVPGVIFRSREGFSPWPTKRITPPSFHSSRHVSAFRVFAPSRFSVSSLSVDLLQIAEYWLVVSFVVMEARRSVSSTFWGQSAATSMWYPEAASAVPVTTKSRPAISAQRILALVPSSVTPVMPSAPAITEPLLMSKMTSSTAIPGSKVLSNSTATAGRGKRLHVIVNTRNSVKMHLFVLVILLSPFSSYSHCCFML